MCLQLLAKGAEEVGINPDKRATAREAKNERLVISANIGGVKSTSKYQFIDIY